MFQIFSIKKKIRENFCPRKFARNLKQNAANRRNFLFKRFEKISHQKVRKKIEQGSLRKIEQESSKIF